MANEETWRRLIGYVRNEEMTPAEAEGHGVSLSLEPFRLIDAEPILQDTAYWPISFAILWVAWRDPTVCAEQWDRCRYWGRHLWRDLQDQQQKCSLSEAEALIWNALAGNHIVAIGMVPPLNERISIQPHEWVDLTWSWKDYETRSETYYSVRNKYQLNTKYIDVLVGSAEVLANWPAATDASVPCIPPSAAQVVKGGKGGRKPKPGLNDFWIEIVGRAVDGNLGDQEKLTRLMIEWCRQNSIEYEADTISKKVSSLFAKHGWKDGTSPD